MVPMHSVQPARADAVAGVSNHLGVVQRADTIPVPTEYVEQDVLRVLADLVHLSGNPGWCRPAWPVQIT